MKLASLNLIILLSLASSNAWAEQVKPALKTGVEGAKEHQTNFKVKFGAVTVGKVRFGVLINGNNYTFTGDGKTQGLADWFAPGKAIIRSHGELDDKQNSAHSHLLSVTEKKKETVLKMAFNKGEVQTVSLTPDKRKKKKPKKYVMIKPDDLKNVVDPASTMVVRVPLADAKDPRAVCGRTFRVYDGDTRFDMRLSYKRSVPFKTEGFNGTAYVCKLRYVPVSGHRKKHNSVKQMANNKKMEIWLAPIKTADQEQAIFTAIRIIVPTWIGTFAAEPSYFGPAG